MKSTLLLAALILPLSLLAQSQSNTKEQIDYKGFLQLTADTERFRESRMLELKEFVALSKKKDVIILDTRSTEAYDQRHIKGAVHLNFSDFTADKLAKVIPSKETTILIYCNNNFVNNPMAFAMKSPPLALNIPTFINLIGYGYKNVYELGALVTLPSEILELDGSLERGLLKVGKSPGE